MKMYKMQPAFVNNFNFCGKLNTRPSYIRGNMVKKATIAFERRNIMTCGHLSNVFNF